MKRVMTALVLIGLLTGGALVAQESPKAPPAPPAKADAPKVEAAKAPPAPVLSELDTLKIENGLLKIKDAQTTLDKLRSDFQAFLQSVQKPGYQIAQGQDGRFVYVAEPKAPETKDTTKKQP